MKIEPEAHGNGVVCRNLDELKAVLPSSLLDWDIRVDRNDSFYSRVHTRNIGDVRLIDFQSSPCRGRRGPRELASDARPWLGIAFLLDGLDVCQSGAVSVAIKPGDIAVWHSRNPMTFQVVEPVHKLLLMIPEERMAPFLPIKYQTVEMLIEGNHTSSTLLAAYLRALTDQLAGMAAEAETEVVEQTLGLLGLAITARYRSAAGGNSTTLYERISKFIDNQLQDTQLSPTTIARQHKISERYVHKLFADHGHTVCGWLRERRLARCRADLAQGGRDTTIAQIAYRWGFNDAAHFSRIFRSRYGVSPRDYRSHPAPVNASRKAAMFAQCQG